MIIARSLACALAFLVVGCAATQLPPPELPALRVGVTPDLPPYAFRQADGSYAGVEIDFATRLSSALGRPLTIVPVPWDEQFRTLLSGGTDMIMSGMSITPERAARVAFSAPYLKTNLRAVVRREDAERWATADALLKTSPRIGVKKGTTGENLVRAQRPDENVVFYRQSRDAIIELRNYRIDVYVSDAPVIEYAVLRYPGALAAYPRGVGEQSLAWAFRPGDVELRGAVDGVLARWRADGTLRAVLEAWPSIY